MRNPVMLFCFVVGVSTGFMIGMLSMMGVHS